ncbi:response regulator [bacterium]|nr:response regulator [bacterium]
MSKKILVIDDNEAVRKSFILALEPTGYKVDVAESGEKGIEKVRNTRYDLIYLDLKMPGLDGIETLREIRKIDKDVAVYIITAYHDIFLDKIKNATADGLVFEIFRKPIYSDRIVSITKGVLDGTTEHKYH